MLEEFLQLALRLGVAAAARVAGRTLVAADENVLFEFRHELLERWGVNREGKASSGPRLSFRNGLNIGGLHLGVPYAVEIDEVGFDRDVRDFCFKVFSR